jgi:hypothetical protein
MNALKLMKDSTIKSLTYNDLFLDPLGYPRTDYMSVDDLTLETFQIQDALSQCVNASVYATFDVTVRYREVNIYATFSIFENEVQGIRNLAYTHNHGESHYQEYSEYPKDYVFQQMNIDLDNMYDFEIYHIERGIDNC